VGDIDFEVISAAENSNKFQKARFWKEKSVEDVVFAHISNLLHGLHIRSILPFHSPCAFFSTFTSVMYGVVCPIYIRMLGQKANECAPMLPVSLEQSQWITALLQKDRLPKTEAVKNAVTYTITSKSLSHLLS
jgi:hypothetical protein